MTIRDEYVEAAGFAMAPILARAINGMTASPAESGEIDLTEAATAALDAILKRLSEPGLAVLHEGGAVIMDRRHEPESALLIAEGTWSAMLAAVGTETVDG